MNKLKPKTMKINETTKTVGEILFENPFARETDLTLYREYIKRMLNKNPFDISYGEVSYKVQRGELAGYDTVSRIRRQLQEKNPHLRGVSWDKRHEKQDKVKKDLGYHIKGDYITQTRMPVASEIIRLAKDVNKQLKMFGGTYEKTN